MTFGIVISSYKYGHLAAHCIETVLAQTKQFDEIYFVDDGVGDCHHLLDLYGDRVKFIFRNENLGTVANFQDMLMNKVATDYVMFLGADNWLRSDTLSRLSFHCEYEGNLVTYDIQITGELRDEIYNHYRSDCTRLEGDYYWQRENKHHGSMLYDVKMAKSVGGYAHNGGFRTDEDANLWEKLINADAYLVYIPESFLYYRRHKENFNKY
jgi:glycosyltransferase involved in cell wall biosynthesis